jgi:hypothetical protein
MTQLIVLITVLSIVGCRPRTAAVQRSSIEAVLTSAEVTHDPLAAVARARGIPDLRTASLPEGVREIRLADSFPWIVGYSAPMLRIVQQSNTVTGEIVLFWRQDRDQPLARSGASCAPGSDQWIVCASAIAIPGIDWDTVAVRLDSMGAWTLSERCENLMSVQDAGDLHLQRRNGARFDAYRCNAPRSRDHSDAGRRARELFEYLHSIARSARR